MLYFQAAWDEGVENLDAVRRENKNLAEEIKVIFNNFFLKKTIKELFSGKLENELILYHIRQIRIDL